MEASTGTICGGAALDAVRGGRRAGVHDAPNPRDRNRGRRQHPDPGQGLRTPRDSNRPTLTRRSDAPVQRERGKLCMARRRSRSVGGRARRRATHRPLPRTRPNTRPGARATADLSDRERKPLPSEPRSSAERRCSREQGVDPDRRDPKAGPNPYGGRHLQIANSATGAVVGGPASSPISPE
jgi:hypothetical protein